ncbi:MAG: hypothetical protein RL624_1241 [Bacteroidota bacterium]
MLVQLLKNPILRNLIISCVVILLASLFLNNNKALRLENERLTLNVQTLAGEISFVKTQNGKLAAQTDLLLLRTNELKTLFPREAKRISDLGVNVSKATQVSTTVVETQKNIITLIRDSIVNDTIHVKVFEYKDQWYQISGISKGDSQRLKIHSTDTLTQVVFKGERIHPWLWVFSPRKLQQRVSVSNPNSTIKYSQLIQIQKQ